MYKECTLGFVGAVLLVWAFSVLVTSNGLDGPNTNNEVCLFVGLLVVAAFCWLLAVYLYQTRRKCEEQQDEKELSIEMRALVIRESIELGNSAYLRSARAIIAVSPQADHLGVVARTHTGIYRRILLASEIVSVETVADIRTTTSGLGIGSLGGSVVGMVFGSFSHSEVKTVWLKVLVRDVSQPWLVFRMPDIRTAEEWKGIITLVINRLPTEMSSLTMPAAATAGKAALAPVPAERTMPKAQEFGDDGLLPLGS